jgi:WD40 repeat protein
MSIQTLRWNEGRDYLLCGTTGAFIMYKLQPEISKHITKTVKNDTTGGTGIGVFDNMDRTNITLLVGGGDKPFAPKNCFTIFDIAKEKMMSIDLKEPIKNGYVVRANNGNLQAKVIILGKKMIRLFTIKGKMINSKDTFPNDRGLSAVSCPSDNPDNLTIATLGLKQGQIAIWKPNTDDYNTIDAHIGKITSIALSYDGTNVVTASENATNVHVYSTLNHTFLHKFRRGTPKSMGVMPYPKIWDVAISNDKQWVACCSNNGTIHIFDTKIDKDSSNSKSIFSYGSDYLPEYFNSSWSGIKKYIGSTSRMICAFDSTNILHIATYDGDYYRISGPDFSNLKGTPLHTNNI